MLFRSHDASPSHSDSQLPHAFPVGGCDTERQLDQFVHESILQYDQSNEVNLPVLLFQSRADSLDTVRQVDLQMVVLIDGRFHEVVVL